MANNFIKKKNKVYYFGIFLFAFLLYSNSLKNKYALDDEMVTLNNERVEKGISGIPAIFTKHHSIDSKAQYEYRPVVLLTFALEYEFFGRNPFVSHLINVLIYALTCVLIFYLLLQLLPGYNLVLPLLATLFFISHPLHTEVVDNLKSRDELLAFFSSLLSLFFILKYIDKGKKYFFILGIISLFIAILSKKGAIIFVALIPLVLYFFKNLHWKNLLTIGFFVLSTYLGYVVFKRAMLSESTVRDFFYFENPLLFENDFFVRIPAGIYTIWKYFELLIFPHPLSFYYGYNQVPIAGWTEPKVWISLLFHSFMFFYAVKNFTKKHILSFAILFYLAAIFPFSNIPTPAVGIIADRFTYIASLGFCIAVAFLILKFFKMPFLKGSEFNMRQSTKPKPMFFVVSAIILLAYSFKTISRNPDWKDHLTLYRHDIKHVDKSAKAHALISNTIYPQLFKMPQGIQKDNLVKECVFHYKKALEIYPDYSTTNNNLGTIYFSFIGDFNAALPFYQKAVSLDTNYLEAYFNLGYTYEKLGKPDSAIFFLEKALSKNSTYKLAFDRLFNVYFGTNQFSKAAATSLRAAEQIPGQKALYLIYTANAYSALNDTASALIYFIEAYKSDSGNADLCEHIAKVFQKTNQEEKAIEYFEKAHRLRISQQ